MPSHMYREDYIHPILYRCDRCFQVQGAGFENSLGFCDDCMKILKMSQEEFNDYVQKLPRLKRIARGLM